MEIMAFVLLITGILFSKINFAWYRLYPQQFEILLIEDFCTCLNTGENRASVNGQLCYTKDNYVEKNAISLVNTAENFRRKNIVVTTFVQKALCPKLHGNEAFKLRPKHLVFMSFNV